MKSLDEIALSNVCDKASSHHGYTLMYESLFSINRLLPVRLLEIGVQYGASIKTWLEYFPRGEIIGVDCTKSFSSDCPRFTFIQADQANAKDMNQIATKVKPLDIVIDDGCHTAAAVKTSFDSLWPVVVSGGVYIIEDVFTFWHNYWKSKVDGPSFLCSLISAVNQGGKNFYGMPDKPRTDFTALEREVALVTFVRGLAIITKK